MYMSFSIDNIEHSTVMTSVFEGDGFTRDRVQRYIPPSWVRSVPFSTVVGLLLLDALYSASASQSNCHLDTLEGEAGRA